MGNKCTKCGGSKSVIADDYFIKKCWCDDLSDLEGDMESEEDKFFLTHASSFYGSSSGV